MIAQCTKRFAVEFDGPACGDLARMVEAHRRYLSSVEDGLFLSEDCTVIRTAMLATLDSIMEAIRGYQKFRTEVNGCFSILS